MGEGLKEVGTILDARYMLHDTALPGFGEARALLQADLIRKLSPNSTAISKTY